MQQLTNQSPELSLTFNIPRDAKNESNIYLTRVDIVESNTTAGGLSTGYLRFPHLLVGIASDIDKNKRLSQDLNVCIVGPGIREGAHLCECPQLVELRAMMPKAHYLLLDNDKKLLELLGKAIGRQKLLAYDPTMLRGRTLGNHTNPFLAKEPLLSVLNDLKPVLANQTPVPKEPLQLLKGMGESKEILVKIDPNRIELRDFDIRSSQFKETDKGQFDVVVATMSITNTFCEQRKTNTALDCFQQVGKFLELLRPGGVFYADAVLFEFLLKHGEEGIELGHEYLEAIVGNRLEVVTWPLDLVEKGAVGIRGEFKEYSYNEVGRSVTTATIQSFKRKEEKVALPAERLAEISSKLAGYK